jgi:hypothetical protein
VSAYECIERRNSSNLSNLGNLVVIFPVICCKKWSDPSNLLGEENLLETLISLYGLLGSLHFLQQITGKITVRLLGLLQRLYFCSTSALPDMGHQEVLPPSSQSASTVLAFWFEARYSRSSQRFVLMHLELL